MVHKQKIAPYFWILMLIGLPAGLMVGLQMGTIERQYERAKENFASDVKKAIQQVNNQYIAWNSHTSNEKDSRTFNKLYTNADSSFVLMIAQSVQTYPLLDFKGDTVLPALRQKQFERFRKELEETRRKDNKRLKEYYILRSIQYCKNCEANISIAQIFPMDSLVRNKLKKVGIQAKVEVTFYNKKTKKYSYNPNNIAPAILSKATYQFDFTDTEQLHVYFPHYNQILFQAMLTPLVASVGLIIVSLLCYIFAARILWKQKKLSELKNDFINNVTHEFKTPIATIAFAVANIENEKILQNPEAIKQFTKVIKDENKRLNQQVEKVLQAAILDKNALELKKENVDMHALIQDLTEAYKLKIKPTDQILLHLQAGKSVILGDKFHLSNAISNLLDNAIKYAKENIQIHIETQNNEKTLQISIQDNGIGISKEHQAQIFEKFYRVPHGNIHNVKGFGLGLSYVKEIITQHKGHITVQSKLQQGSTFILSLPYES